MNTDTTKPHLPCPLTDDPAFIYYNSASTDIQRTWRKFGWKPLQEKGDEVVKDH
jgi:hypothetical protein